jgi:glycosylphosphatidylinositol transamidase (GPIT) subunit GPI8
MATRFAAALALFAKASEARNHWAILAVGGPDLDSYRHQADMFHLYSALVERGFEEDHIILLTADTLHDNPLYHDTKYVYNKTGGQNVYPGADRISVNPPTPDAFLAALRNELPELYLDSDSNVLVAFSGMTAPGIAAFPRTSGPISPLLFAEDLLDTVHYMREAQLFNQLAIYMDGDASASLI